MVALCLIHTGCSPPHTAMIRQHNLCSMKLMEQRSLLETKDAIVTKTKEKLDRSAQMQVHTNPFFSTGKISRIGRGTEKGPVM